MNKKAILPALGFACSIALAGFGYYSINKIPDAQFPMIQPAFELQGAQGNRSLQDSLGNVAVVFFGYTHCPDICPATIQHMNRVIGLLSEEEQAKTDFIFISLDSERDTPETVSKYVRFFDKSGKVIGLTGSNDAIVKAADAFKVASEKADVNEKGNYAMNHSTYFFVVRPDGELGNLLGHKDEPEKIANTLRHWYKWAD